ncbi:DUF11 domain-containing protein [Candidatus Saccharibacteria bacterium]|nr:DUF11 domain-containing protein [Candidatus Saccharibacteria bacterium]
MKNEKRKKITISATILGFLGALGLCLGVDSGEVAAWGPQRTTYTNESPAPQAVFNSITNNAAVGDERNFVRIVEVHEDGTRDAYANEVSVSGGHDYEVYIYYHNNASSTYNDRDHNYVGVAREVRLSAAFPESIAAGNRGEVNAIISASNTLVPEVWDEAYMNATEDVTLAYITGSAKIYNNWNQGTVLSTNLFSADGTFLGLRELNGIILGCDEYSGQVVFRIRAFSVQQPEPEPEPEPEQPEETDPEPEVPATSSFEVEKTVSIDNGQSWVKTVEIQPGSEVEFRIHYKNTGTAKQTNVTAFDTLEGLSGMSYISGTTRVVRGETETIVQESEGNELFNGGILIGDVEARQEVYIYYKVKANTKTNSFTCGRTVLYNLAGVSGRRADQTDAGVATKYDKVEVRVDRNDSICLPAELPETGPAQIILASIVCLGILTGFGYWLSSRIQLKKLQKEAKGETNSQEDSPWKTE